MRIEGLENYQRRGSAGDLFQDLPPELQKRAHYWLTRFVAKYRARGLEIEPWRFAILCGQAKRLARKPPTSAWGRSMHAKRGGYAVQQQYRAEGRHPTAGATAMRVLRQQGPPVAACNVGRGNLPGPPELDMTEIHRNGVASGLTGRSMGENLVRQVTETVRHVVDGSSRFGEHIAPPGEQWEWQLRLRPIRRV
jgi:hypothetical protein